MAKENLKSFLRSTSDRLNQRIDFLIKKYLSGLIYTAKNDLKIINSIRTTETMSDKENAASTCPFCALPSDRIIYENEHAVLVLDAYPVSPGHSLIISKTHAASWFDITTVERESMLALLDRAREKIISETSPGGFNIGINDGSVAGQTVPHLHMHLIPRYMHDQPDPRGGVRWVIPEKAKYWR